MTLAPNGEGFAIMELRTKHFEIDDIAIVFHAAGHTACWLRGDNKLIVDRPDGSAWCWTKEFGRWTEPGNNGDGPFLDGWQTTKAA
jgi:hypothetical protein